MPPARPPRPRCWPRPCRTSRSPAPRRLPGYHASNLLIGTPDEIFEKLKAAQEACSFSEITIVPQFGTMPYDDAHREREAVRPRGAARGPRDGRAAARGRAAGGGAAHDGADRHAGRRRHPTTSTSRRCGRSTRAERDKRLRTEGSKQYVETGDEFAEFAEIDPHTPCTERDPITEDIDVAVLGGGFGGLLAAAHLKKAGVEDVRIIEMGGDFGGVWYWNRYPGIQCDNEAYCYIPLLEELDFIPSKKFADGAEIYRALPQHRKALRPLRRRLFSTQVATCTGTTRSSAGGSAPTAATTSGPASS